MRSVIDEKNSRISGAVSSRHLADHEHKILPNTSLSQVIPDSRGSDGGDSAAYIGGGYVDFFHRIRPWFVLFLILVSLYSCLFVLIGAVVPTDRRQHFIGLTISDACHADRH
jgi:hypothetical protein